mgnify:FL=1
MTTTTTTQARVAVKLRLPPALARDLKEQYAQTYPQHRLSFNAWLVELLADGAAAPDSR